MFDALKKAIRFLWRSAQTGRFVTKDYAEHHPDVSVREQRK